MAALYEVHAPSKSKSSQILGLSNEVKYISELQVAFEKIAKNLTKFASKNPGVRKLNFPSVYICQMSQVYLKYNERRNKCDSIGKLSNHFFKQLMLC